MTKTTYPQNLIQAIYPHQSDTAEISHKINSDALKEQLLTLTIEQQLAIELYYRQNKSYAECGETLGVSREKAREYVAKALNKLRHASRQLKYETVSAYEYEKLKRKNDEHVETIKSLKRAFTVINQSGIDPRVVATLTECIQPENLMSPIIGMGLSGRTVNALVAADIKTVKDVLLTPEKELKALRNFGPKCQKELKQKISEHLLLPKSYKSNTKKQTGQK